MDPRMYPTGNVAIDANAVVTTPTLTDKIVTYRGDSVHKAITLANLLQNTDQLKFATNDYTASGAIAQTDNFVTITNATPATIIALTIAAPTAGRLLVISQQDTGSVSNTVTLTTGTFDATATILTINAQNETIALFGVSGSRFVILENVGSVATSS